MFLRNYDNYWVAAHLLDYWVKTGVTFGDITNFGDGYINQKTTNGSLETVQLGVPYYAHPPFLFNVTGICLGNGNTPVTYEDYKLSGSVISNNLIVEKNTLYYNEETKKRVRDLICSYYNNTTSSITISEWGLFRMNSSSSTPTFSFSNSSSDVVMVFREVLMNPITILPGETGTITLTLEIPTRSV